MKEQLISFDTAKLAKEKGFELPTMHTYNLHKNCKNGFKLEYQSCAMDSLEDDLHERAEFLKPFSIYAPTQSLLQRWLREEHKIYVDAPLAIYTSQKHSWYLAYRRGAEVVTNGCKEYIYTTYEEALEKGLQEALKLIGDKL